MGRVWFGLGHIIFLLFLSDSIKYGSKNLNLYLIRSDHSSTPPDPGKINKYLLKFLI
jgi:hypothetical protein